MGGLYLAVYKVCKQNLNIDFVRSFMDLKFRGLDDTHWSIESTVNMKNLSPQQTNIIQANLSRDQIQKYTQYNFVYGFHRSCINDDTFNGSQPFEDPIKNQTIKYPDLNTRPLRKLLCNGEIYNYDLLKTKYNFGSKDLSSSSDVEIFLPLYIQNRASIANPEDAIKATLAQIDGDFSMILTENVNSYDLSTVKTFVARDFLGIKPLFYVYNKNCSGSQDFYLFVSEIKALPRLLMNNESYVVGQVPPGTFWSFDASVNTGLPVFTNYYDLQQFTKLEACVFADTSPDKLSELYQLISDTVISSVTSRYSLSRVPVGVLLSGGFDSCVITSILCNYCNLSGPLYLFTIGDLLGGEDIDVDHAKEYVKWLKIRWPNIDIQHHIVYVNNIELLTKDINNIIYHLESYEPETVRDSIPYYYLFDYIQKNTDVKVILVGDGLEELCGYANYDSLDDANFQLKSVQVLERLCHHDILRTDRMSAMFGLEIRHPFLSRAFVEVMLKTHPKLKRPNFYDSSKPKIHKYIIRKAFESGVLGAELLSSEVLWRGYRCICECLTNFEKRLYNFFEAKVTDVEFTRDLQKLVVEPAITSPTTKEELYYRMTFRSFFPGKDYLVKMFWGDMWNLS